MPQEVTFEIASSGTTRTSFNHYIPPFCSGQCTLDNYIDLSNSRLPHLNGGISWKDCTVPVSASSIVVELLDGEGNALRSCSSTALPGPFPPSTDGRLDVKRDHYRGPLVASYRISLKMTEEEEARAKKVGKSLGLLDEPITDQVCLFFPATGHKLFTTASFLSKASPYWKTRLAASDFSDMVASSKQAEDSDDEADKIKTPTKATITSGVRILEVSDWAYSTYRALLAHLDDVPMSFAPMSCALKAVDHDTTLSSIRSSKLREYHAAFPSSLLPVSPASLYRLSHFLEVDSTRKLALDNLKSQLTPAAAAHELFNPDPDSLVQLYDEFADMVLEYAMQHVKEVTANEAVFEAEGRVVRAAEGEEATAKRLFKLYNAKNRGSYY